jgi:cell division septum initiation protein DivIVA
MTIFSKPMKSLIASRAKEAEAWQALHDQVTTLNGLDKQIEGKKKEMEILDEKTQHLQGILDKANVQAEEIVGHARAKLAQAASRAEEAENTIRAAGAKAKRIIADARSQADEIVTAGQAEARRATKLVNQIKNARA